MKAMQRFTPRGLIAILVLAVAVVGLTLAALIPSSRQKIRSWLRPDNRQILAKTSGYASADGPFVSVFKIRENGVLVIEVYTTPEQDGSPKLMQKFVLNETRDGYFNFMGNATNLALSDTDQDGALDILAPTFDDQMTARLNVFRFNRALGTFEKAIPPPEGEAH